ncbi:MAG TPA: CPBP family intramembrane glutamic endopeptidase, partial [Acidimicrobiales bacterium]
YNVLGFLGLWSGFVGVPVYLSRTRGTGRLSRDFGLRFGGPADIGLGLAAGLVTYGVVEVYSAVIQAFGDHANLGHEATQLSGHGLGAGFVLFGLAAAVGAPIAEEIFFRGLAQPVLQRYLGGVGGLGLTAVAFGFAHLGSNPIEAVVPLAVFGAVLGVLAWRTGRLGPGIVAHMTFNAVTVVLIAASR